MKRILVNMNRSGYYWNEANNTTLHDGTTNSVIQMTREISDDSHPSISALRNYEQYDYAFLKGTDDYILAIRNLNEPRTDGSGRNLRQHYIFEDDDKHLLLSIFAYYLSCPRDFEEWLTHECFKPGQNAVLCKLAPFNEKLKQIISLEIDSRLSDIEFAISSPQSADWLQEKLQITDVHVKDYLNKLDSLRGVVLLHEKSHDTKTSDVKANEVQEDADSESTKEEGIVGNDIVVKLEEQTNMIRESNECISNSDKEREIISLRAELKQSHADAKKWKMCSMILGVVTVSVIVLFIILINILSK